jgi:hypothetical protein
MKRQLILVFISVICSAPLCRGQSTPEVFGGVGWGKAWDDEGSIGAGIAVNGGAGFNLLSRLALEFEITTMKNKRESDVGFQADGQTTSIGPNLVYHFSSGRTRPFILGGIHFFHHRGTAGFAPLPPDESVNDVAIRIGGGVKAFVSERVFLRPEFICVTGGEGRARGVEFPISAPRFSVGIGYQW